MGRFFCFIPEKNPNFPRPRKNPDFLHPQKTLIFRDGDKFLKGLGKIWGRGELIFWGVLGYIPEKPQFLGMGMGIELPKGSGMVWGRGSLKFWGFGGKNPQKSPNFWAGTGERILGIFNTLAGTTPVTVMKKFYCKNLPRVILQS